MVTAGLICWMEDRDCLYTKDKTLFYQSTLRMRGPGKYLQENSGGFSGKTHYLKKLRDIDT